MVAGFRPPSGQSCGLAVSQTRLPSWRLSSTSWPAGFIGINVLHAVMGSSSVRSFTASRLPVSSLRGSLTPGLFSATTTSADFLTDFPMRISPGKNALLLDTAAPFTSTTEPLVFAVWCQLVPSRRPFMAFLFIGLQVSSSVACATQIHE